MSKSWPIGKAAYRAGTDAGGRNDDRAVPAAFGFAATRFPLSTDSR